MDAPTLSAMACVICLHRLLQLLLVSVLLVLNVRAEEVEGFWNVDCGSAVGFDDPTTNLTWVGDGEYVNTGNIHLVSVNASLSRELTTLRAFPPPWPRKNCFSFYFADDSPQILVRTYFYYGNYDGREKPPRFQLQFDGHPWRTVETTIDSVVSHEVIYVTTGTKASICVSRTDPEQHPFMSAIEVRELKSDMYSEVDEYHALYPNRFVAFGAEQAFRYPDDPYDRIWNPTSRQFEGYSYKLLANNATLVNTSDDSDLPPKRLLRSAAAPLGGPGSNLTVKFPYMPPGPVEVYIVLYFTEVTPLAISHEQRFFVVCLDGACYDDDPVVLDFGFDYRDYMTSTTSNPVLDLMPNKSAALPPLISGLSAFVISDPLNNGTKQQDVDTLTRLKDSFKILNNWSGDPCFPEGYNWEWIGCSIQNYSARINKLLLGGFGLSGTMFPDVTPLDALVTIDLHGNNFTGSAPDFLGDLSELTVLNLADNDFSEIPPSILNNKNLLLNYTGNPKLCKQGQLCVQQPRRPETPSRPIIVSASRSCNTLLPNLVLLAALILISTTM